MKLEQPFCWTELLPTGEEVIRGSLAQFFAAIVSRQPKKRLPPLVVFTDILARGLLDGGMGGGLEWNADEVSIDERSHARLQTRLQTARLEDDCPARCMEEWRAWCAFRDSGIDYAQHLAHLERLRELDLLQHQDIEGFQSDYTRALSDYCVFISEQLEAKRE